MIISLRIPDLDGQLIKCIADRENLTLSEQVRRLISQKIEYDYAELQKMLRMENVQVMVREEENYN